MEPDIDNDYEVDADGFVAFPQAEVVAEDLPLEPKHKIISRLWTEEVAAAGLASHSEQEILRFRDLCEAVRAGDLEHVESLVAYGVDVSGRGGALTQINAIDEFDCSPLILASLCGHEHVVKYLLEHGAICDRDTFQGERCLYGALTDSIRTLLLSFDISKAVDEVQPFAAHVASLLSRTEPATADVVFRPAAGDGREFALHRFVLTARSQYFETNLEGRWRDKAAVKLSSAMDAQAFDVVVKYLYAADLAIASDEIAASVVQLAGRLDLPEIPAAVENLASDNYRRKKQHMQNDIRRAQTDFETFVLNKVIAAAIQVPAGGPDAAAVSARFLADGHYTTADVLLQVEADDGAATVYYPTHRAMLIRSEYFFAMFTSSFLEGSSAGLQVVHFAASPDVAEIVLMFLYTDRTVIPPELALGVLYCADLLLLDRLKGLAAIAITGGDGAVAPAVVYDILRAGWATRMDRLERFAAKYFADHLDAFIDEPHFADIVIESAERIRVRDETDTIELVDDIRFYLAQHYGIIFEDDIDPVSGKVDHHWGISMYEHEYNAKIELIESLLGRLNLEA
ncbi:uncharacterized protein V1510DRAFT_309085 [Dipodascopsis tothii]|uniref:uncharacterized protein n=1 Tax=Dipodascopsis tothii TaxID=44089 RepID=UPI0034CE04F4